MQESLPVVETEPVMVVTYADWRNWPGDETWKIRMLETGRVLRVEPAGFAAQEDFGEVAPDVVR